MSIHALLWQFFTSAYLIENALIRFHLQPSGGILDEQRMATEGRTELADQVLKDKQGRKIATISTASNGVQTIKDPQGRRKGTYDPKSNATKDAQGRNVGTGNLLTTLL